MADNPTPELLAALNQFQQTTIAAYKDSTGYGYKYASEESINDTLRPAKVLGLTHCFTMHPLGPEVEGRPGQTEIRLRVFHTQSGGWLESTMVVDDYDPNNKKDARHQQRGAGISYAKRYMLPAMFGLATSENEGETITPAEETPQKKPKAVTPKPKQNTPQQAQASAKPAADPFKARREACQQKLVGLYNADKSVVDQWRDAMKLRFDGEITADKPTTANLTTEEQIAWCEEWISDKTKATK